MALFTCRAFKIKSLKMKKKIVTLIISFITILYLLFNVGFQCGNVRIGKQIDFFQDTKSDYSNSSFYRNYYNSNKLLVINLWATWCKPCLEEVPLLNSIKEMYIEDSINFLGLSIDNDSVKLVTYLAKDIFKFKDLTLANLNYRNTIINLLDNEPLDKHQLTRVIPKTYLVKNKKVLKIIEGSIDKDELIAEINKLK